MSEESEEHGGAAFNLADTAITDAAHAVICQIGALRIATDCVGAAIATGRTGEMPIA